VRSDMHGIKIRLAQFAAEQLADGKVHTAFSAALSSQTDTGTTGLKSRDRWQAFAHTWVELSNPC
jgi:hypothetical protein